MVENRGYFLIKVDGRVLMEPQGSDVKLFIRDGWSFNHVGGLALNAATGSRWRLLDAILKRNSGRWFADLVPTTSRENSHCRPRSAVFSSRRKKLVPGTRRIQR